MRARVRPEVVPFDEVVAGALVIESRRSGRGRAVSGFLAAAVLVGVLAGVVATPSVLVAGSGAATVGAFWDSLPTQLPLGKILPQLTTLTDKDGVPFATLTSENRVDVKYSQISTAFVDALVSSEDARFWEDHGFDLIGIARAAAADHASGTQQQGASTITQQLVQNILMANATTPAEKEVATGSSYNSKVREIRYSIALEKQWSKQDILTAYANAVYFGNGAYGVEAAARLYFNTTAKQLTAAQAATLVAQVKSPTGFDPFVHPDSALNRRNWILGRMATLHKITPTQATAWKKLPLDLNHGNTSSGCEESAYPYYCSLVREEILTDTAFGKTDADREETLRRGGLTIQTALDRKATDSAQAAATGALGNANRVATGIAVVVPGTGHIAAVAQNRTWDQTQVIYATSAFQPGSSFKPITLATALSLGIPATTKFYSNGPYRPAGMESPGGGFTNDGGERVGTIDSRAAMRMSVNVYFVKLIQQAGVINVANMAHQLGISTIPNDLNGTEASLTLGTYDASPLEMANAYSSFIAGGVICDPTAIVKVTVTDSGRLLPAPDTNCRQVLTPDVAAELASVVTEPLKAGGTLAAVGPLTGHDSAAKTGTTDDSDAIWTTGFTGQYATSVWVGDPRGGQAHPLDVVQAFGRTIYRPAGAQVAGPIWKTTMTSLESGLPNIPFPASKDTAVGAVPATTTEQVVPNVTGMTTGTAADTLLAAGLVPVIQKTTAPAGTTAPGVVVAQSIPAGHPLTAGTQITLTLSHGSRTDELVPSR